MASIGHVAVGLAVGRFYSSVSGGRAALGRSLIAFSLLSLLPDIDVLGMAYGIPYAAEFGHRGALHSLFVAVVVGALCRLWARSFELPPNWTQILCTLVVASHGVLDAMTNGGLGVALMWPLDDARFFLPWRPIPVAPIGARILSPRGLHVMGVELLFSFPLIAYAIWPRRARADDVRF